MKKTFFSALLLLGSIAAFAQSPTFETAPQTVGTSGASYVFLAQPTTQARVVGAIASSDLATSALSFMPGGAAFVVTVANTNTSATSLILNTTNGLAPGKQLLYQPYNDSTNIVLTVATLASATNITVSATPGIAQTVGDSVYLVSQTNTLRVGATTNANYQGEAIAVAPRGRPLRVTITGTAYSSLDSISVHRDQ